MAAGVGTEEAPGLVPHTPGGQGRDEARRGLVTRRIGQGNRGEGPGGSWAKVRGTGLCKRLAKCCLLLGMAQSFLGNESDVG